MNWNGANCRVISYDQETGITSAHITDKTFLFHISEVIIQVRDPETKEAEFEDNIKPAKQSAKQPTKGMTSEGSGFAVGGENNLEEDVGDDSDRIAGDDADEVPADAMDAAEILRRAKKNRKKDK